MKAKTETQKTQVKKTTKASKISHSEVTTPTTENIAADAKSAPQSGNFYSPLKQVMIEKSIEWKKDVHAKLVSDQSLVSYPTILDMVHGVKKRYGKRTLKAVADYLQVTVERIEPR